MLPVKKKYLIQQFEFIIHKMKNAGSANNKYTLVTALSMALTTHIKRLIISINLKINN